MALYKYCKPSKSSETLATQQNNLSKRGNEKVIHELRSEEYDKRITCGHQLREPRLVNTLHNMITHRLLEPCV